MVLRRCPPSPVAQAAQLGDRVGYIRSCTSTDVHVDIYRLTDACKVYPIESPVMYYLSSSAAHVAPERIVCDGLYM